jgi:hypothetical protein
MTSAILAEASDFGERHLAPLAAMSDKRGCRMAVSRVTADNRSRHDDLARSTRSSPIRISP